MSKTAMDNGATLSESMTASRHNTPKNAARIRNMTGVYLGAEGSVPPPKTRHNIPPLIRRQTLPQAKTPREQLGRYFSMKEAHKRSAFISDLHRPKPSPSLHLPEPLLLPRLPALVPILQQQKVEVLKAKEESRGFNPLPIKRAKPKTAKAKETDSDPQSPRVRALSPDYNQLTKKTTRTFTIIKSNGVSSVDYADNRARSGQSDDGLGNTETIEEIQRVASTSSKDLIGLASVYNNVCKIDNCDQRYEQRQSADVNKSLHHGNSAMLRSLLPQRRVPMGSRSQSIMAPLTVKSFRNPRNPHTVVQYSEIDRPKSTKGQHRPPTVPAPYFYDSRKMARSGETANGKIKLVELPDSVHGNAKILAAPGVGAISRQASSKHIRKHQSGGIEGQPPPTMTTAATANGGNNSRTNVIEEPFKRPETQETTRIDPPVPTATPTHDRGGTISPSGSITDSFMKTQDSSLPEASSTSSSLLGRQTKAVSDEHNLETKSNSGSIKVSVPSMDNTQPDSRESTPDRSDLSDKDVPGDRDSSKISKNVENENDSGNKEIDSSADVLHEENKERSEETPEDRQTIDEKTDSDKNEVQGSKVKGDDVEVDGDDVTGESAEVKSEGNSNEGSTASQSVTGAAPPAMILIAVEDDGGESQPVAIDLDSGDLDSGHTDKEISQNAHSSDEQVAEYIENANRKQTELQQLLEEHSQLVTQIDVMEKNKITAVGEENDADDEEGD
ncbi:serine-rich adhesin for platelets-like isoform X1 [Ptychodera flava]|uniref:serine-rich adhesin for platelets-like isoform X1 n=1 Tax=Ptychodera flava TaxID=63121 RepID=UPI00396A3FE5